MNHGMRRHGVWVLPGLVHKYHVHFHRQTRCCGAQRTGQIRVDPHGDGKPLAVRMLVIVKARLCGQLSRMGGEEPFTNQWPAHQQGNVMDAQIVFCIRWQRPLGHRRLRLDTLRLIGRDGGFTFNGILAVWAGHNEQLIGVSRQLDGQVHTCKRKTSVNNMKSLREHNVLPEMTGSFNEPIQCESTPNKWTWGALLSESLENKVLRYLKPSLMPGPLVQVRSGSPESG